MKIINEVTKRASAAALAALTAVSLVACGTRPDSGSTSAPTTDSPKASVMPISGADVAKVTMPPNITPMPVHNMDGYSYRFIRIAYSAGASSVTPLVVNSKDGLRTALSKALSSSARSTLSVDEYMKDYDEAFFEKNYILVFNLTFGSGSVVPEVKNVTIENGVVTVLTEGTMEGDVGTADMASHMCLLSLDANRFPETSTFNVSGIGTTQGTNTQNE